MATTVILPKHFITCHERILGDFTGVINYKVAEQIKNKARFSEFSAWGVSGKIWWSEKNQQWCAEVWKKNICLATLTTDAIEDLVFSVQKQYGWK
jgi:hypothetical protein